MYTFDSFLHDLIVFLSTVAVLVAALMLYVFMRVGMKWNAFVNHWKTTGDGAPAGIIMFPTVLLLAALVAFGFNHAFAAGDDWFRYTEVYAGIDYTHSQSPQCVANNVDDRLTSNGGIRQHIYSWSPALSLVWNVEQHHSCAVGVDAAGYDATGILLNWRFDRVPPYR